MTTELRLLDPQELAELGPPEAVRLPLDLVDPNPRNPRKDLAEVDALAENIRQFGLLQPITVRRISDRYELLGGHRRRAAFQLLQEQHPLEPQWRTIPAVVRTMDDDQSYLALISGQVHNRAWKPREEAFALERLALAGLTLTQIGSSLNRTESWASKRLRVYADSVLSGYVQSGRLSTSVAEEFLIVLDVEVRRDLAERAASESWSQDKARGEVRSLRLDKQLREVAKRARELLEILSVVDVSKLPLADRQTLWTLRGRITALGRGPVIPTIEQAQAAAKINPDARPRGRTNSTRTKRRTMPRPG